MSPTPELGWQLASFMLSALVPSPRFQISSHALFRAYGAWCVDRHAIPLLEAEFLQQVAALAHQADIRILHVGANVVLHDVSLAEGFRRES